MKIDVDGKEMHIFYRHEREKDEKGNVSNYGGKTIAYTVIDDETISGVADCSDKDIYSKKLGRIMALGRLFKTLGLDTHKAIKIALCKDN
jgi:hypothetical protein